MQVSIRELANVIVEQAVKIMRLETVVEELKAELLTLKSTPKKEEEDEHTG